MSKTILQRLFDGEIYPSENIKDDDPKSRNVNHTISDEKEHFLNTLTEGEKIHFERLIESYDVASDLYGYKCFSYGFSLGIVLSGEAFITINDTIQTEE